jgi:ribosomal protein S18 acetylase RimI-like enzyme
MAQHARRYCALAAFDDDTGELIGVCTCRLVIVSKSLFSSEPQLYIMTLGVHPSYRRRHIAESMLRMVSEWFEFHHSCTTVYLHVLSTNEQAVAFYRRCGFKCMTTLKRYYVLDGVHHDALVMEKQLHLGASYSLISSIRHALESLLCLSTDDTP